MVYAEVGNRAGHLSYTPGGVEMQHVRPFVWYALVTADAGRKIKLVCDNERFRSTAGGSHGRLNIMNRFKMNGFKCSGCHRTHQAGS